jgi:hypothetical protein
MDHAIRIVGWLIRVGEALIAVNLLTLLIAAFVKRLRGMAGGLVFFSASVWALTLTVWCATRVFFDHGWFLTILGFLLGGVGIIPVAFVSLLLDREWLDLFELLFQVVLVLGGWYIASRLMLE